MGVGLHRVRVIWIRMRATWGHDDGSGRCALRGGTWRAGERHSGHLDAPEPVKRLELGKRLRVGARHAERWIKGLPLYG
eukprot:scaffold30518_cov67-Phaeocystis_antarctica.AAC.3